MEIEIIVRDKGVNIPIATRKTFSFYGAHQELERIEKQYKDYSLPKTKA